MSGVEIWKVEKTGELSLSQPLADGRTLTWIKGQGSEFLVEYAIRLGPSTADNPPNPDFSLLFETQKREVLAVNIGVVGGMAALGFDRSGTMVRLLIEEPKQRLWLAYSLVSKLPDCGIDDRVYLTDANGYEIRTILGNDCLLGINFVDDKTFIIRSVRWEPSLWLVSNQPIGPEQLAVFSPDHWGRRDKAELMVATIDQIISQRVKPI